MEEGKDGEWMMRMRGEEGESERGEGEGTGWKEKKDAEREDREERTRVGGTKGQGRQKGVQQMRTLAVSWLGHVDRAMVYHLARPATFAIGFAALRFLPSRISSLPSAPWVTGEAS